MRLYFCLLGLLVFLLGGCKNNNNQPLPSPVIVHPSPPIVVLTPPIVPEPSVPTPVVVDPVPIVPTPLSSVGTKRAVLVGINKYINASQLRGCVNDVLNIKKKAISSWGFKEENIKLLIDEEATIAHVKEALSRAVGSSKAGDTFLYWHSSHGTEDAVTADANGEPNHANQLVCCYDFNWDREHQLIDKDYVKIFSAIPEGVYFNWASDSCYSGDLSRYVRKKHVHPNTSKDVEQPEFVKVRVAKAKMKQGTARSITGGLLDVGYLSGCKYNQLSADTEDENGIPGGAMTIYFLKVIDQNKDKPLSTIASELDARLAADGYDQAPQAEGADRDKPWLK